MDPKDAESLKTVQFYTAEDVPVMKVPLIPGCVAMNLVPIEYFIGGEQRPQILPN